MCCNYLFEVVGVAFCELFCPLGVTAVEHKLLVKDIGKLIVKGHFA